MPVNFKDKYYTHLDIKKKYINYSTRVRKPEWVEKHAFYPFIHYQIVFHKYVTDKATGNKVKKDKVRDICYSAHVDRFIYQYYAEMINCKYNQYVKSKGINKVATAYRNNKKGLCNIHFAKEALEFINKCEKAWIFVGDFTGFFDSLDAKYLKEKLQQVLEVDRLSKDQYAVYRSITKYSYVERSDIERYLGKKCKDMRELDKYFDTKELQKFKKEHLQRNKKSYGIPQGSAISAVYANVYMVDFDKQINDYVTSKKGLYRRYCDDIIIVIPMDKIMIDNNEHEAIVEYVQKVRDSIPNLKLNLDKTEQYYYDNSNEEKLNNLKEGNNILDYLGFSFDGKYIRLREKSLFKFYCRAYKKVEAVRLCGNPIHQIAAKKGLYKLYTHMGDTKNRKKHGNFLTYARRADEIFSESKYFESKIHSQVKRHWHKINKRLNQ